MSDAVLVEIGTEELPPKSLATLGRGFAAELRRAFVEADLVTAEAPDAEAFWSPRRLAVRIPAVRRRQPDKEELRKGPGVKAAYDKEGKPTKAAEGFARSAGVTVESLEKLETDEGAWVVCRRQVEGRPAAALLPALVESALARLPIARRMRWGAGDAEFVRPVHWVVLLHGADVVDGTVLGIRTGRTTSGHRVMSGAPIELRDADDYPARLESEGRVRVNAPDGRLDGAVAGLVTEAAAQVGGVAQIDDALVAEVAALVEWPVPVTGSYDVRFLALPAEVLVSVLETHQRYFPVRGADGALMPHFVTLANIESRDPDIVRRGNERVVLPRLTDAEFFFREDRKAPLETRAPALADVTFQAKAGSLADKSKRIAALAARTAERLGADVDAARRAGELAKCDLLTLMVGEFPELQGVMGGHYAAHDGESGAVARAIGEHYLPRHAGDALPQSPAGRALAIADRIDTLVVMFASAGRPSGDKDPFGLRRAALGVLRILVDGGHDLDLASVLDDAVAQLPDTLRRPGIADEVFDFSLERLRGYLLEAGGRPDVFDAVLAVRPTRPADFVARVHAVEAFLQLPEAEALAAANKRIGNILRQAGRSGGGVDDTLLVEPAEQALWHALSACAARVKPMFAAARYADALRELAALRAPVDDFFDNVMVMSEDAAIRENRLAILAKMLDLFRKAADVGRLQ